MIQTYETWAKQNDKVCRRLVGYEGSRRMFRITDRPTILQDEGFRLITNEMFDPCTIRTEVRGVLKTPRQAVKDYLEQGGFEYTLALYYTDALDVCHPVVWIK